MIHTISSTEMPINGKNTFNLFKRLPHGVKVRSSKAWTSKLKTKNFTIEAVSELRAKGLLRMAALDFALPSTKT